MKQRFTSAFRGGRARTVVLAACLALVLPLTSAMAADPPPTVTAGALPAPQTNGIVFSLAIVGNTAYAGGRFSKARPAGVAPGGSGEVTRNNLLAFDVRTGKLLSWAPKVTGTTFTSSTSPGAYCRKVGTDRYVCDSVFRIKPSPGKTKLFVGGDFDRINGLTRSRVARFDVASGGLDSAFRPNVGGRVRAISITKDTVYLGGGFKSVNGTARTRLAAVDWNGALKAWKPSTSGEVFALAASPGHNRVVVGGGFSTINGVSKRALAAVSGNAGATVPWQATMPSGKETVTDILIGDSGTVYVGAYCFGECGRPRFEGRAAFDITNGAAKWWDGCLGDTQAIALRGTLLYSASHTHDCWASNAIPEKGAAFTYFRLIAESTAATGKAARDYNHVRTGEPIPTIYPWFPNTNSGPSDSVWKNGPWAIAANSEYVVAGGEFTTVNGKAQQSLTRFAARGVTGAQNYGPQVPFPAPRLSKDAAGKVVIRWKTTWDAQNSALTYRVMRAGKSEPVYTITRTSRPWSLPELSFVDTTASSGTYWIRATDVDGATRSSPQASI